MRETFSAPGRGKPVILTDRLSKGADDYRLVALWLDERINGTKDPLMNQVRQLVSSI